MFRIIPILGLLILAGCGESLACAQTSDCYQGEYCSEDGECLAGKAGNNGGANNGANNGNNGANNGGNNGSSSSCVTNLLDLTCEDDENDQFGRSFNESNVGCLNQSDDELTTMDETQTLVLCGLETQDLLRQPYVGCRDRTFVMEVQFDPKDDMCNEDLVIFEFGVDGKSCDEPNDEIECARQPDGGMIVKALVRPSTSVNSAYINIKKTQPDVHFQYDLRVIAR